MLFILFTKKHWSAYVYKNRPLDMYIFIKTEKNGAYNLNMKDKKNNTSYAYCIKIFLPPNLSDALYDHVCNSFCWISLHIDRQLLNSIMCRQNFIYRMQFLACSVSGLLYPLEDFALWYTVDHCNQLLFIYFLAATKWIYEYCLTGAKENPHAYNCKSWRFQNYTTLTRIWNGF